MKNKHCVAPQRRKCNAFRFPLSACVPSGVNSSISGDSETAHSTQHTARKKSAAAAQEAHARCRCIECARHHGCLGRLGGFAVKAVASTGAATWQIISAAKPVVPRFYFFDSKKKKFFNSIGFIIIACGRYSLSFILRFPQPGQHSRR